MDDACATFAAVDHLSGSDDDPPTPIAKRSAKRKRSQEPKRPIYDSERIRCMLGNPKCHCKRKCLNQFVDTDAFRDLQQFRAEWADMHKLDQDTVEPGLQPVRFAFNSSPFSLKFCRFLKFCVSPHTVHRGSGLGNLTITSLMQAFHRIRDHVKAQQAADGAAARPKTNWQFLRRSVCIASWKKLHVLGTLAF